MAKLAIQVKKRILVYSTMKPKKSLGQNFLRDKTALARIIVAANLSGAENILEIGPGEGVLTERLLEKAGRVLAVEKDEALAAKLRKQTRNHVVYSVGYPLLVNNWTRRAMNEAAELGADAVDADIVNAL